MKPVEAVVTKSAESIALGAAAIVITLSLATVVEILLRWLLNHSVRGMSDLTQLSVLLITVMCFPICALLNEHVHITFVGDAMGGIAKRVLRAFGALVSVAFISLIGYQAVQITLDAFFQMQVTSVLQIAIWPFWMMASIFFGFTIAAQILAAKTPA